MGITVDFLIPTFGQGRWKKIGKHMFFFFSAKGFAKGRN